jgi:hypothetical protein
MPNQNSFDWLKCLSPSADSPTSLVDSADPTNLNAVTPGGFIRSIPNRRGPDGNATGRQRDRRAGLRDKPAAPARWLSRRANGSLDDRAAEGRDGGVPDGWATGSLGIVPRLDELLGSSARWRWTRVVRLVEDASNRQSWCRSRAWLACGNTAAGAAERQSAPAGARAVECGNPLAGAGAAGGYRNAPAEADARVRERTGRGWRKGRAGSPGRAEEAASWTLPRTS